jgi:tetratricopeptide (TPR) repeat protein
MCILFLSGLASQRRPLPRLAVEQVNAGPACEDEIVREHVFQRRTPGGICDVQQLVSKLPTAQLPDAIVCLAGPEREFQPRRLGFFPGPKVLLVDGARTPPTALLALADYASAESFDRVVVVSGRHSAEWLRGAGVKNVFWFPGLLCAHDDHAVGRARCERRGAHVALREGIDEGSSRALRWAGALVQARVPVELTCGDDDDALEHFGAAQVSAVPGRSGELSADVFRALASGAAVLLDRPAAASGWADLWREGRELVTAGSTEELVARARHLLAHPEEAAACGRRGQAWFEAHLAEKPRLAAFEALVFDGRAFPGEALTDTPRRGGAGATRAGLERGLAAVAHLQTLAEQQERVQLVLDAAVPAEIATLAECVPGVEVARAAEPEAEQAGAGGDIFVTSRSRTFTDAIGAVRGLWLWDAKPADFALVSEAFAAAGFAAVSPPLSLFQRAQATHAAEVAAALETARECADRGEADQALGHAKRALGLQPRSADARLLIADLALEAGNQELRRKLLAEARTLAPDDGRATMAAQAAAPERARRKRAARLVERGWEAFQRRQWAFAIDWALKAEAVCSAFPAAMRLRALAGCVCPRYEEAWQQYGRALRALRECVARTPQRAAHWFALGLAHRFAGGTLPEAIPAFRRVVELDPENVSGWFALGEALHALGDFAAAEEAFRAGLQRAPHHLGLMRWLGFALKQQGQPEEAHAWHWRSFRARASAPPERNMFRDGARRRVVFVVQNGHSWPCMASVHAAFAADPRWETIVVALPWLHPSFQQSSQRDEEKVFGFLREQGIAHVRAAEFSLQENRADLVFLQNPYDNTRPSGWKVADLVRAGHRLCYVPYAIEFAGDRDDVLFQFNYPLQRFAWAIVARSTAHRALFAEHCWAGNAHVLALGHPKFDALHARPVAPDPDILAFAAGRPVVLWTPHFDFRLNGTRGGDGYSTFLRWRDFLWAEFERRPDVAFVIRPHPTFFSTLEQRGLMTREEGEALLARAAASTNIRFHRVADYFPLLQATDALISDASSVMFEFGIHGRPVCYLHNPTGPIAHADYEVDLDYMRQHFTWATSEAQIRAFLDGLPQAMADETARETRAVEMRRRMGAAEGAVGPRIKLALEARLETRADAWRAAG